MKEKKARRNLIEKVFSQNREMRQKMILTALFATFTAFHMQVERFGTVEIEVCVKNGGTLGHGMLVVA